MVDNSHMKVWSVQVEQDGKAVEPFLTCERKDSVSIVIKENNKFLLVRQHRFACDRYSWEVPQGAIEYGESAEEAALREVYEETGYNVDLVCELGEVYEAGDWCTASNKILFVKNVNLSDYNPELEFKWFTIDEIKEFIKKGLIFDASTISSLYLYDLYR